MKIIHLITLLELGGAQGNTLTTVQRLSADVFEAHLWCGKGAYWDREAEATLGAKGRLRFFPSLVRPVHPGRDLLALIQLTIALIREKPDILHTHSSKAGILGRVAGWLAGVPVRIHTFHGFGFNDQQNWVTRRFFVLLERFVARLTHILIFVSEANRDLARSLGIGSPGRYRLIRSGISVSRLLKSIESSDGAALRRSLNIPEKCSVITTIGAFKPQKNILDFVSVARTLIRTDRNVVFLIIGDGQLRPAVEEAVRSGELTDHVRLLGWVDDVGPYLAISDVFVLTSLWEGLPRALVEALVLNRLSVCYKTDGVQDLADNRSLVIVPQKNTVEMAEKIGTNIRNRAAKPFNFADVNTSLAHEFDIDTMVKAQEALYKTFLKAGRN